MTNRMLSFFAGACLLLSLASAALAGPNEGGTLILHANPSITFTSDIESYCGMADLDSCSHAVTSVAWEPGKKIVFHALAAFPAESSPRLKGLSFGISYDPAKFILAARGSCADFELPDGAWPDSGSGTAQTWTTATQTGLLTEAYWFVGYAYADQETPDSTTVELIPHPLHGGTFVDDAEPRVLDTIAAYGALGFGADGDLPCPLPSAGDGDGAGLNGDESSPGELVPDGPGFGGQNPPNTNPLTYLRLATTSDTAFVRSTRELIREYGLGNTVGLAPDGIFCRISEEMRAAVSQDSRVSVATVDSVPGATLDLSPGVPGFSEVVWNSMLLRTDPDSGTVNPGPIDSVFYDNEDRGYIEPTYTSHAQTSVYMLGDVGVSLLIMESNDTTHCDEDNFTENWNEDSLSEKADAIDEATYALVDLMSQAPTAGLNFYIVDQLTCATDTEPIWQGTGEGSWRLEALSGLGFTTGNLTERERALANQKRMVNKFDWWFIAYLVRSACKENPDYGHHWGWFGPDTTQVGDYGWATLYGPSIVSCSRPHSLTMGFVLAHETCHVFGAGDEYDYKPCSDYYGYLREQHLNSRLGPGCEQHVDCMMGVDGTWNLCEHSRGQVGWKDSDADGAFDPLDHPQAENSILIGDRDNPLSLGDEVNIYQAHDSVDVWVKRLDASRQGEDGGYMLWDGMDYRGVPVAPGAYKWSRNYGAKHAVTLAADQQAPALTELRVKRGSGSPCVDTLIVEFSDPDTHGGRVRAVAHTVPPDSAQQSLVVSNEFWLETNEPGQSRRTTFSLPSDGLWAMNVLAWDVGGGHQHEASTTWWYGNNPPAGVGFEPARGPELRLSPSRPNPSGTMVSWGVEQKGGGTVNVAIVGADGRRVRSWPEMKTKGGVTRILWDGRDDRGLRVASGRYYMVVRDGAGRVSSRSVTVVR